MRWGHNYEHARASKTNLLADRSLGLRSVQDGSHRALLARPVAVVLGVAHVQVLVHRGNVVAHAQRPEAALVQHHLGVGARVPVCKGGARAMTR